MAKRTRITIVTDSLLVLRGRTSPRAWCSRCSAEAEVIPLNHVGVVASLRPGEVQAWMESEDLHQITTADGAVLICLNSMLKRLNRTRGGDQTFG
jgi:hypothetical protein